ncbi:MAG: TonB-dependent receptor [Bacteroidaceae bacterium]|nr:TonB-dependent receptor [Bacteroidaceae bacterium]MDO4955721.1 TonB-dependent receptor [Bacteroidales bacterium]
MKRASAFLILSMLCLVSFAQSVKGVITDNTGEPVIGANVLVKGTTNGTITDFDGNYTVSGVKNSDVLVISYIGYLTQEIKINGQKEINVVLKEDSKTLDDVVVIGYGTVRKKDLTGSVATVSSEKLTAVPVASATEALTGKMAGVQITTTEGSPDAEMKIRVRGGGSITGDNTPLFIVDGFPVESISDIPASDIEDMTVLKDASSTAIYGSRGANGVILVTTKSGKEGKVKVSYNAYLSTKKIAKTLDVLGARDYANWQWELALLKNNGKIGSTSSYSDYFGNYQDIDMYDNVPTNDWQNLTFGRTGQAFNHNLSINGGSETVKYAFNYAYMKDKAIMEGSNFKRNNLSLKLQTKPAKGVNIDFSVRYSNTLTRGGGANDASTTLDTDKRLKYSVIYTPFPLSNLDPDAGSSDDALGNLYNPIQAIADNDRQQRRQNLNMNGSIQWEVIKGLRLKAELGYDDYTNKDQRFYGSTTYYVRNTLGSKNPAIQLANTSRHKFRSTNTISYDFAKLLKNDSHHLNAMVGHEYVLTKQDVFTTINYGFPSGVTADQAWNMSTLGTNLFQIDDRFSPDDKLLSFFGRVNYDYQSKYLVSATFRADGSSKFGAGNRWGYFPSVALAWRVSSEPFMEKTQSWLDDLKLRVSYGTAGNNNIPAGQIVQEYSGNSTTWINGVPTYWAPSKTMANPNLKWETTITRNIGLDYTILGGRINGTIEAYLNTTKDLLINFPVPGSGYDYQYRNMGKTQNKGIEFTINYSAINKKNVGLDFNFNVGFNKNEIKSLGVMDDFGAETYWGSSDVGNDYWIAVGGSVGQMYGYKAAGRYEVSDFEGYDAATSTWTLKEKVASDQSVIGSRVRPGSIKLQDISGPKGEPDGVVDEYDKTIIGNANPKFTGGFGINARFYGFDLSANFNFSVGNDVYNANKIEFSTTTHDYQYRNMLSSMAEGKRWTNLNEDGTLCNDPAKLAAMNANTTEFSPYTTKGFFSDWAVENGSFLRLNTLTLGYTLPKALVQKAKLESLRFYATCYNVFCLTSYSGYDPEVSTIRRTALTPGVDYSAYPKSRQFVIGLNLNF